MANELQVTAGLAYNKPVATIGAVNLSVVGGQPLTRQIDIATGRKTEASQVVGTSEEQFALVDVASVRYFQIQNIHATAIIRVDTKTRATDADYCMKLLPGDITVFPPNANALFLKSDIADGLVSITAVSA
jgi:hypothetical protein